MRVRDKNNPEKVVNAIQYYGEKVAGFDGEYSERPKWLDYVIKEYGDKISVKLFDNREEYLYKNDWFIYDDSEGTIKILEIVNNNEFEERFIRVYY